MPSFCRLSLIVAVVAVLYALFIRRQFSPEHLDTALAGRVAIVTGASRGIGRGIAIGLGEAKATVYITGRTVNSGDGNNGGIGGASQVGSLEETCIAVREAGGKCIPCAVDSGDDAALEALFARVVKEQGRLDILVNNAFSAVSHLPKVQGLPFWEKGIETWDIVNNVGLRSHYVASVHAAKAMKAGGLIINLSSFGGMNYIFDVAYGVGKSGMDRMANDMAVELATEDITMVSMWPGLVKTENVAGGALDAVALKERRGLAPGSPGMNPAELMPSPLTETPLFTGRAVATLARDRAKMQHTGRVVIPAIMARDYDFLDERGVRSPSIASLKWMLASIARPLLLKHGLWECGDAGGAGVSDAMKFLWNTLPDGTVPGLLLKLGSGAPNL